MFQHMASLDNYKTFHDLLKFAKIDKTITRQDLPYFPSEQLTTLISLALDELARRLTVRAFVTDKIAKGKVLLEASSERTLEALRNEFTEAIADLKTDAEEVGKEDSKKTTEPPTDWTRLVPDEEISNGDLESCF